MRTLTATKQKQPVETRHFEIDVRNNQAKLLVSYLMSLNFVKFIDDDEPNAATLAAKNEPLEDCFISDNTDDIMTFLKS